MFQRALYLQFQLQSQLQSSIAKLFFCYTQNNYLREMSTKQAFGSYYQCWESQIFFLLRKAQIRNENWIHLLRIRKVRKCKAFAPQ